MADQVQQVRRVPGDAGVETETTRVVNTNTAATATNGQYTAARLVWFIAGVLLVLLAFRFVFVLLGANPSNGFVNFIYTVSHPLAAPFFGIFSYHLNYGVSRVEVASLIAMVIIALVAYGLARLLTINRPAAAP